MQLHAGFGFEAVAQLCDYLAELGVSHAYLSPYLQAAPGSTHGYDVIDYGRVNEELGGAEAHRRMVTALHETGLSQVLDIVPNHMSIATAENVWWWDVLENGPSSRFAHYFDVDWAIPDVRLRDKVLLPVLGDHYGRVLEAGHVRLHREGSTFSVLVYDRRFPVAPDALGALLARAATRIESEALAFAADVLVGLPGPSMTDDDSRRRRHRDKTLIGAYLQRLFVEQTRVADAVDTILHEVNRDLRALDAFLERQNYRLAFWRTARYDLDYRRFFDINELAGLRTQSERVFRDTHQLVLEWVRRGEVQGLRVDHPDGLVDPAAYFERLRRAAPSAWIIAEKILARGEELPSDWPIDGTTGYDFMACVTGLFVHPEAEGPLTEFCAELTGFGLDFPTVVRHKKRYVLQQILASDSRRVTEAFRRVCDVHPRHRDYARQEMREALEELIVELPVYRTYVRAGTPASERDRRYVEEAVARARAARTEVDPALFELLRTLLTGEIGGELEREAVMRFQQLTGPATAKGVEDTAFYDYHRLLCLNEVGADPSHFGTSLAELHAMCGRMQRDWPTTMLSTSSHDTKRSGDVRARLAVLTEVPQRWTERVAQWVRYNERHRPTELPGFAMEYHLYQTLVGAWPISEERVQRYMLKAAREAKANTSWLRPDPSYEVALQDFVHALFGDGRFVAELSAFVAEIAPAGYANSLAQTLVALTAPGVPDIYQGNELWDFSLTDPDNRRPVDFALRQRLLRELRDLRPEQIAARYEEGLPKLWLVRQGLRLRRELPRAFAPGSSYEPVEVRGPDGEGVIAFTRGRSVAALARRFMLRCADRASVVLPHGRWRDVLSGRVLDGGEVTAAEVFAPFPVALLVAEASAPSPPPAGRPRPAT